ncbi:E3 SUMO-protein ligase ZBED1-like [Polyodon spathula]|uniref:E3 SUMO-protein ligase ZBED1-like n=1 Tax=Polyodon spathula TaxID=7913 RepID=UPI001B7DE346|nr:E3 SUMO-protein ligase ZBED1-like [Polyodon spathula]
MSFQTYPVPASSLSSALKRKGERVGVPGLGRPLYPVSADRRKSKVWQYYTQLSESHVECNVCKRQLSFHNSTTTMREHLVRKHSIRDSPPQHIGGGRPPARGPRGRRVQSDRGPGEEEARRVAHRPRSPAAQDSGKRAGLLSELILEMLFRDLHPVSVVEERGFRLLLGCLEPSFRAPPRSHLSGMLWHRHSVQRQLLQGYLRAGVGRGGAAVLCTDHWGVTGSGRGYLTISILFVDRDWRLARCVLETRPAPEPQRLRDALGGALAQFGLPESSVLGVVLDRPDPSLSLRSPGGLAGWQGLPCAALWLGECVVEALSLDPVQEALAAARVIVTHFQQEPGRAALLNPDEAGAAGSRARLPPLDQPARWVTTLAMCDGLLELRWVVSSVLEGGGSPPVPNLADQQWRLLQELVPALRTVRLAASFLSEEPNAPVSALLPCLHGVARLLGRQLGECGLQAARSAIGRMRVAMQKRWRIGEGEEEEEEEEEEMLHSPLVLSSFLDPRFKELRFLSPDARSRLHGRVKELLSAQREEGEEKEEEAGQAEGAGGGGGESSPMSCVSPEGHDLQAGGEGEGCRISMVVVGAHGNSQGSPPPPPPPPQSVYDILLGEDPTERMPEIQQQLENYIAEPLCKRSCSPLDWWRGKELRFPALAGLARRYLAIPSTAVPPERAFAAQESPALRRRATVAPEHLDQILFLNQNCDFIEGLRGGATGAVERRGGQAHARETLYQSLVSFESQAWLSEDRE